MTDLYEEADLYHAAFDWPVDAEVDWLLGQAPGARSVLEPFCGSARFGPAFAERGVRYVGFDRSPAMIERASRPEGVTLMTADARAFEAPGGPFDLAWCPINSIRHLLEDDDMLAHLRCVREHLADGGVYVIESDLMRHDGPWPKAPDDKSTWTTPQPDGSEIRATWFIDRCDLARRRVWERARIERVAGDEIVQRIEHTYEMRLCTADDWPRLAEAEGFRIAGVFAHHAGNKRPAVELAPELENSGVNHYLRLEPVSG